MTTCTRLIAAMATLTLTACPKPLPDPEPADPCKGDQTACGNEPAGEAPPPIGTNSPPPK